jgi:hypothetical protein
MGTDHECITIRRHSNNMIKLNLPSFSTWLSLGVAESKGATVNW